MTTLDERTDAFLRGLTADQLNMLLTPLNPNRVKDHKGNAHLEAWDVRRWLTRIFGFGGWDDEILSMDCIHSVTSPIGNDPSPLKHRCTAVYRVTMRLIVKDQCGNVLGHWDDGATGEGINQVSVGDAHDLALKAALSQALKRCAVNLGDQFGLSLYNKGDLRGVVVRTLGHPVLTAPVDAPEDAPVLGGELEEQHEAPQDPAPQVRQEQPQRPNGVQRSRPSEPAGEWNGDTPPPAQQAGQQPASRPQLNMLAVVLGKKRGNLSRPERLGAVAKLVGRPLASSADLTKREASRVIDLLNDEPDLVVQEQPVPQGLEADLLARINGVTDLEQLDEVWSTVQENAHAGVITSAQEQGLMSAMNRRESELKKQPVGAAA